MVIASSILNEDALAPAFSYLCTVGMLFTYAVSVLVSDSDTRFGRGGEKYSTMSTLDRHTLNKGKEKPVNMNMI